MSLSRFLKFKTMPFVALLFVLLSTVQIAGLQHDIDHVKHAPHEFCLSYSHFEKTPFPLADNLLFQSNDFVASIVAREFNLFALSLFSQLPIRAPPL